MNKVVLPPLPEPVRSGCYPYNGEDMIQYAAAVTAAKDAEIAALRAEVAGLREALENIAGTTDGTDCNAIATMALKGDW